MSKSTLVLHNPLGSDMVINHETPMMTIDPPILENRDKYQSMPDTGVQTSMVKDRDEPAMSAQIVD